MVLLSGLLLLCVGVPAALSCFYLLVMTLLSGRPRPPPESSKTLCFDFVVPAHNEATIIERTIASLRAVHWPRDKFRILVVADNCTDETARVAEAAGAEALIRNDPDRRGKGYALQFAFRVSKSRNWARAVVVVDADSEVSANILEAFAARLEGDVAAVQSHYGVRNPLVSWRTRLITIAKGAFHIVRSRAREKLGVSCGLRGNGWCVSHKLLEQVPYQAFSLTEDVEYGITIGLAGFRVAYADEAHADADMVSGEEISRKQRQRWEHGRFELIRSKTGPLLEAAFKRRSPLCLDLALDLLVLPLSYVAINVLTLLVIALAAYKLQWAPLAWLELSLACCIALCLYVARGWQLSGVGAQGIWDLARVPWFLAWKLWLILRRRDSKEWVRTGRENN